ncbi:MAG: sigma factor-like helix-turn-helix DNA-binding protein [Aminivibrio sp.]
MARDEFMLSRRLFINQLYDIYGPLLTEKQREAWELHEFSDLSLSEMAEKLGASRQAVHDLITRSRDRLEELESLLGFHRREALLEEEIRSLRQALGESGGKGEGRSSAEEDGNV